MEFKDLFKLKKNIVKLYMKFFPLFSKERGKRTVGNVYLYYRICNHGYPKEKPKFITKENCLRNAVKQFPLDKVHWFVYADNVCDDNYKMICKYIPEDQIRRIKVGHGPGTFRMVYEDAIKKNPDDLIYFLEDDFPHLNNSYEVLIKAAECNYADYYTLYDLPDKYECNFQNQFVNEGGEKSVVYWCGNHHWKQTNSTTMTFAAFVDTLRKDKNSFWRWTDTRHPFDFHIFMDLKIFKKRKLISPIPSLSTHGEYEMLAHGIDWEQVDNL